MMRTGCITFLLSILLHQLVAQVTIYPDQTYQTIVGFSASDCWTGHYVGKYWEEPVKNNIVKWLFSRNLKADGSPEGIGLSMWRVNLGGGTLEQGDSSDIEDISRRAECFLDSAGNYDWTKQSGQQWFMQKAKEYGCEHFVAFSNTPLVHYTLNGKGYSGNANSVNLQPDKYDDFAGYLATVVQHFHQEGYNFSYISPVNEPQWGWDKPEQEGTPWTSAEIKNMVVELDKSIQEKNVDTKIMIAEVADWRYAYSNTSHRTGNQIAQFFNPASTNYVGNLPSVAPVIAGHSYWTHGTNTELRNVRISVKNAANSYNTGVFQTEWSLLGEAPGENFPGYETASYMDIALVMARVIHSDLAYANASSWSYWTAMGQEKYGHKNRFLLIALAPGNPPGDYNIITSSGMAYDRSTLWALGNYSYFIRPGYKRIRLDGADNLAGLMGTAYFAPDSSKIVAVYVNMATTSHIIKTSFTNLTGRTVVKNKLYITNSSYNLRKTGSASFEVYSPDKEITIPARSVATILFELEKGETAIRNAKDKIPVRVYPNPVSATGELFVSLPENIDNNLSLSIFSTQGNLVYSANKNNVVGIEKFSLPANLHLGVYLLQIRNGNNTYHNKLIINSSEFRVKN